LKRFLLLFFQKSSLSVSIFFTKFSPFSILTDDFTFLFRLRYSCCVVHLGCLIHSSLAFLLPSHSLQRSFVIPFTCFLFLWPRISFDTVLALLVVLLKLSYRLSIEVFNCRSGSNSPPILTLNSSATWVFCNLSICQISWPML